MIFNIQNRTYDILKWLVMIVFPAFAVLYGTLADTLGLGMGPEIVATIGAITGLLGAYLQMNMVMYARYAGIAPEDNTNSYPFSMSTDVYDTLKWMVKVALPSLAVAYVALASTWGFPYIDVVPVVFSAIALFLGTTLQISAKQFKLSQV